MHVHDLVLPGGQEDLAPGTASGERTGGEDDDDGD